MKEELAEAAWQLESLKGEAYHAKTQERLAKYVK